jgi:hypothetical protein
MISTQTRRQVHWVTALEESETRQEPSDLFYAIIATAVSSKTDVTVTVFSIKHVHHYAVRDHDVVI